MTTMETLRRSIREERERRVASAARAAGTDILPVISGGDVRGAVEELLFFTPPADFLARAGAVREGIEKDFGACGDVERGRYLRFLVDFALALCSFLPRWNLDGVEVGAEAERAKTLATGLAADAPGATSALLESLRAETAGRFAAEGAAEPEKEAAKFVGGSVGEYVENAIAEVESSNLRRIAEMRHAGDTITEISNDYAAFLEHALYVGASFATTNPPLVDIAWQAEPGRWDPVVDGIISANPDADGDALARLVTLEVVLANMLPLRPIFLLTEGRMGCVCLQVNPNRHGDADTMVEDALFFYEKLRERLGGVPNVVFKLPGTKAGLAACRELTSRGIGVTITVNFGMFQHLPFVEAIAEGHAIFCCIVEMNGRLAYPVRDELLGHVKKLAKLGHDESRLREAAAWAGVAVVKRLHRLLVEKGLDPARVKPLIASLRIYEGDGYENLPNPYPDITEVVGTSLISVFPNVRRPFDAHAGLEMGAARVDEPVPDDLMEILSQSEIFRQAYYVASRGWVSEEDSRFVPAHELKLENEAGTAAWKPVADTLGGFCGSYDKFVERILARKETHKENNG